MKSIERLGDHVTFLSGFAFKSKLFNNAADGLPVIRIRDVVRGHSETYYSGEYDERFLVSKGDYLIGMDGEFNLAKWKTESALLNQRVCKIDTISDQINREYLGRFLPAALKEIEDDTPFVTVKHLSVKKLNEIKIPLPPLSEQKRIAGILDAADALRAKRREALAQLDTLLQSTFLDLFGDPVTNPKGWEVTRLGDTAILENGDRSSKYPSGTEILEEGILFLSTKNIKNSELILDTCQFISQQKFESLSRGKLQRYDLVITLRGTLGSCAIFDCDHNTGFINAQILILRSKETIHHVYLHNLIISAPICDHFAQLATGAAVKQLTGKQIGNLLIPLPPLSLQQRFTAIVEQVEVQKARMHAQLTELDTLFAALQQRAFNGEL